MQKNPIINACHSIVQNHDRLQRELEKKESVTSLRIYKQSKPYKRSIKIITGLYEAMNKELKDKDLAKEAKEMSSDLIKKVETIMVQYITKKVSKK